MSKLTNIWTPQLLKADTINQPIEVFLCGPGIGNKSYDARKAIRENLRSYPNVEVKYGEDLEKRRYRRRGVDLQTLEAEYAHSVDFTLLMLESPGSITELGTFSMINNIRSRLFVVLPSQFYGAESYIARGPLSLISQAHNSNIIYSSFDNLTALYEGVMRPVMPYKFLRYQHGFDYVSNAIWGYRMVNYDTDYYESYVAPRSHNIHTAPAIHYYSVFQR
ncbi:retron St85 family effector protein [Terasakiella pusilla]|uniref:retron St85 family effector protein n=1 Tax=Terasakiella pusilla TaxID=64973 RepID=UPI003AA87A73